jgi:hypothetical protein
VWDTHLHRLERTIDDTQLLEIQGIPSLRHCPAFFHRRIAHDCAPRSHGTRYHTAPGKLPALESRFRDIYSKLLAKHDLQVVGYWVPEGAADWDNTFVYLVAHSNREEAKKNWDAMLADPEVQEAIKSEEANKLVEKIDRMYMRSTDFSPMK